MDHVINIHHDNSHAATWGTKGNKQHQRKQKMTKKHAERQFKARKNIL